MPRHSLPPYTSSLLAVFSVTWWLLGQVAGVSFDRSSSRCLPGAGPPFAPRRILAYGVETPVIVEHATWTSHELQAVVAGILTEEVLGYEVGWYKGSTSVYSPGLLSGCPGYVMGQPLEGCSEADRAPPKSMINLEYWTYSANKPDYETADRQKLITSAGTNGFLGRNGLFVDSELVRKAWDQADEVGDHYRGWQKQYTVSNTKPIGQNETWNRWSAEQCPPQPGTDCTAEGAILSPACDSVECGTLLAYYSNYVPGVIPQMVKNLELHVGVQWIGDSYEEVIEEILLKGEHAFFYLWTPNEFFSALAMKLNVTSAVDRLYLPVHDPVQYERAISGEESIKSDFETTWIKKLTWSGLNEAAEQVSVMVNRLSFDTISINDLLAHFVSARDKRKLQGSPPDRNATLQEAACEWLNSHEDLWLGWIDCGASMGYDSERHSCVPCDFGTMPAQDPSKPSFYPKECRPCDPTEESSRCRVCSMGQGLSANGVCEDCTPGTYSSDFAGVCSPCPADSYSPGPGSTLCIKCTDLGDYYQENPGQQSCEACPSGAELWSPVIHGAGLHPAEEAKNSSFCVCRDGFWRPDGAVNSACIACPDGAACPAGTVPPVPLRGFWAKYTQSSSGEKSGENSTGKILGADSGDEESLGALQLAGYPQDCGGASNSSPDDVCAAGVEFMIACPMGESGCSGGHGAPCTEAAAGNRCENCAEGYFSIMGTCQECFEYPYDWLFSVFVFIGVVILWILMNMLTAGSHSALDIGLQYMQYVATVQTFDLPWHPDLLYVTQIFAVFNFSIDFVSLNCIFPWGPHVSFAINMYLPIVWTMINAGLAGLAWLWFRFFPFHRESNDSNLLTRILTPAWAVGSKKQLRAYWWDLTKRSLNMLTVVYNSLCIAAFQPFVCRPLADGTSVMMFDSNVYCTTDDPAYVNYAATAGVAMLVYVIGIPAGFFALLYTLRSRNILFHDWVIGSFGWLFMRYEPGLWFWELVILARRFFLSAIAVLMYTRPDFQVTATTVLTILAVAAQFYYRPFVNAQVDIVDCIGLLSLALYVLSGQMMSMMDNERESLIIAWGLMVITAATLATITVIFWNEHKQLQGEQRNEAHMARIASEAHVYLCMKLALQFRTKEQMGAVLRGSDNPGGTHVAASQLLDLLMEVDDDAYGHQDVLFIYNFFNPRDADAICINDITSEVFRRGGAVLEATGSRTSSKPGDGLVPSEEVGSTSLEVSEEELRKMAARLTSEEEAPVFQLGSLPEEFRKLIKTAKETRGSRAGSALKRPMPPRRASASSLLAEAREAKKITKEIKGCQTKIREIGGELAFTVEESALRNWLKSKLVEGDWDMIFKAFRLDACMSDSLGDGFAYGAYSYSTTAVVYRAFVDAHPAVIGWLLNATSQDVETMKGLMATLVYATKYEKSGGHRIYRLIQQIDRGPFLYWLVEQATPEQRDLCREVMSSVHDLHNLDRERYWWRRLTAGSARVGAELADPQQDPEAGQKLQTGSRAALTAASSADGFGESPSHRTEDAGIIGTGSLGGQKDELLPGKSAAAVARGEGVRPPLPLEPHDDLPKRLFPQKPPAPNLLPPLEPPPP